MHQTSFLRQPSFDDLMTSIHCQNQGGRPLIVRFGAMGDMVILTVLIRALRHRFETDIDIACGGGVRPLLEGQPGVGRIFSLQGRQLPYASSPHQWAFVSRLRGRGPGPVWICQIDAASHSLINRAGYRAEWCVSQRDYPTAPGEHAADRLLRMASATPRMLVHGSRLPVPTGIAPTLVVPTDAHSEAYAWLQKRQLHDRPLVLIQAGNKRTMRLGLRQRTRNQKYWPERRWAAVLDGIQRSSPEAAILLLGVGLEWFLNRAIIQRTRTRRAVNIAGDVPVPRLLALCARAQAMISVDTGPAHVAAALGCPLVVLFGSQDPTFYAPRSASSAVEIVTGLPGSARPMLDVTPDAVLAAWDRLSPWVSEGKAHGLGRSQEIRSPPASPHVRGFDVLS